MPALRPPSPAPTTDVDDWAGAVWRNDVPYPASSSLILEFGDGKFVTSIADTGRAQAMHEPSSVIAPRRSDPFMRFSCFLGIISVAVRQCYAVLVIDHEEILCETPIYRIRKVALVRVGGPPPTSATAASPAASAPSPSAHSPPKRGWGVATISTALLTAADYSSYGVKMVGNTLKGTGTTVPELYFGEPDRLVTDITSFLSSGKFYFSKQDLTRSLERQYHEPSNHWNWDLVNKDFVWNGYMASKLPTEILARVPPIIQGHVEILPISNPEPFTVYLYARRSCRRGGVRYQHRGLDANGFAANTVEVEQTVYVESEKAIQHSSFLQVRGSIPLLWQQAGFSPKPEVVFSTTDDAMQRRAMKTHLKMQLAQYNKLRIINLLETNGKEGPLCAAFRDTLGSIALDHVQYTEFDFHRECSGLRFENVAKLIEILARDLDHGYGYFWTHHEKATGIENKLLGQSCVVRTNCLDCLDRTNVVQTWIGRHVLVQQLTRMGIQTPDGFEQLHALAWANVGDAISQCYTGTDALKADFTRKGKRELQGAAQDLSKSVQRFWKNNFRDEYEQFVIEFTVGKKSWMPESLLVPLREVPRDEFHVAAWTAQWFLAEPDPEGQPRTQLVLVILTTKSLIWHLQAPPPRAGSEPPLGPPPEWGPGIAIPLADVGQIGVWWAAGLRGRSSSKTDPVVQLAYDIPPHIHDETSAATTEYPAGPRTHRVDWLHFQVLMDWTGHVADAMRAAVAVARAHHHRTSSIFSAPPSLPRAVSHGAMANSAAAAVPRHGSTGSAGMFKRTWRSWVGGNSRPGSAPSTAAASAGSLPASKESTSPGTPQLHASGDAAPPVESVESLSSSSTVAPPAIAAFVATVMHVARTELGREITRGEAVPHAHAIAPRPKHKRMSSLMALAHGVLHPHSTGSRVRSSLMVASPPVSSAAPVEEQVEIVVPAVKHAPGSAAGQPEDVGVTSPPGSPPMRIRTITA
ncbi:hypothetical protein GGF31_002192 [Allomyces arbusculus]|nr:hypothetical protein GGF31_002192 [Allomyces arbusculus]